MLPTVDEVYAGKNLKADDFPAPRLLTIAAVSLEEFPNDNGGTDRKYVLRFEEEARGFVCAKVNARMIEKYHGTHPENWVGKQVVLYKTDVEFRGKIVDAIRVRMPKNNPQKRDMISTRRVPTTEEVEHPVDDDGIPF